MPFLQYDMADVPILLASLLFGPWAGLVILFVVSAIQAFLFGGDGWVGLVMHFVASGALVVCTGLFYRYKHQHKLLWAALGMALGTIGHGVDYDPHEPSSSPCMYTARLKMW